MTSPTRCTWVWVNSGDGEGQRTLACCSPWGCKESDATEWLNGTELKGDHWPHVAIYTYTEKEKILFPQLKRYVCAHVHSSIIHNSPEEAAPVSVDRWMDKQNAMEYYSVLKRKDVVTPATTQMMPEDVCYSEWKKPVSQGRRLCNFTCPRSSEPSFNEHKGSVLQGGDVCGDGGSDCGSVQRFVTPWTAALQAPRSFTIPRVGSNSCSPSEWCHPIILSFDVSFSSCLQSSQHHGLIQWVWLVG